VSFGKQLSTTPASIWAYTPRALTTWQTVTTTVQSLAANTQFVFSAAGWYTTLADNALVKREWYNNVASTWLADSQSQTTATCVNVCSANYCRLNNTDATNARYIIIQYSAPY